MWLVPGVPYSQQNVRGWVGLGSMHLCVLVSRMHFLTLTCMCSVRIDVSSDTVLAFLFPVIFSMRISSLKIINFQSNSIHLNTEAQMIL